MIMNTLVVVAKTTACKGVTATLMQHWMFGAFTPTRLCSQTSKPVIAAKRPFPVKLIGGKRHSWCACGHSKKQPFCDGTHKKLAPDIPPLRFVPEKDGRALLCGCKHTGTPPYCDHTHLKIVLQSIKDFFKLGKAK